MVSKGLAGKQPLYFRVFAKKAVVIIIIILIFKISLTFRREIIRIIFERAE